MNGMLAHKSVLITGGAGGIGRAAALLFAQEGAQVAVADVDETGANETVDLVRKDGGAAIALLADLTRAEDVTGMVDAAVEAFGRLDCAFNNGGVTGGQLGMGGRFLADWDEEAFDRIVAVNLRGVFLCMKAEIRLMLKQGGGAILNTASLGGITGVVTNSGYVASKHAVVGLTKTAAMEYAPTIRVNALCPGYVSTSMLKDTMSRRGDQILAKIPFRRLAEPREIAEMACWLLSDRGSYATGDAFVVDGGCMAG
jgi:NAD(P)-dependent dehydrogenase (short-subunit alcohol dehydrogenase family)